MAWEFEKRHEKRPPLGWLSPEEVKVRLQRAREAIARGESVSGQLDEIRKRKYSDFPPRPRSSGPKRVVQVDLKTGERVNLFPSAIEASRKTGVPYGQIIWCCQGKVEEASGYRWYYIDELLAGVDGPVDPFTITTDEV